MNIVLVIPVIPGVANYPFLSNMEYLGIVAILSPDMFKEYSTINAICK